MPVMKIARIVSTGRYVPSRRMDNHEVGQRVGEPVDEWLQKNVGIKARHVMADEEVTSDLVQHAATQALTVRRTDGQRPGPNHCCNRYAGLPVTGDSDGSTAQAGRGERWHLRCKCRVCRLGVRAGFGRALHRHR